MLTSHLKSSFRYRWWQVATRGIKSREYTGKEWEWEICDILLSHIFSSDDIYIRSNTVNTATMAIIFTHFQLSAPQMRNCLCPVHNLENWNSSAGYWNRQMFKVLYFKLYTHFCSWWNVFTTDTLFQVKVCITSWFGCESNLRSNKFIITKH